VALGDGEVLVEAVPAWRLRLLKRRLSSLIDDLKVRVRLFSLRSVVVG
jgi:hypothetical protein